MEAHGLMVRSDVAPSGSYVVTIELGDDEAWTLERAEAWAYGLAVLEASTRAAYDAGVLRQLSELGVPVESCSQVVVDLRTDRPPLDDAATAPLRFVPQVAARNGRGFLRIHLRDKPWGQLDLPEARSHAVAVLQVASVADLDAAYRRELVGVVNLDDDRARSLVMGLGEHLDGIL